MMALVIDRLADFLSQAPDPVLVAARLGARLPAGGGDVPTVVISLEIENSRADGIGRFIREGHSLTENTGVVEVKSGPEAFSADLQSLQLSPLPLRRNPVSTGTGFSESDVQVRNITNAGQPVTYRMVEHPGRKEEYRLDVSAARIVFGAPQTSGEKLEVVHWTLALREDVLSRRYGGSMTLEIWASSPSEISEISRRLQVKLATRGAALREKGFARLQPTRLEPAADQLHQPAVGSAFPVWKQKLSYRFEFESESGGESSSGSLIHRIGVDTDHQVAEKFSIPSTAN